MADATPWGPAQHRTIIADGIIQYDTARHGGIKISEERYEAMPALYKAHQPWAGHLWYEEDVDWCVVALAFPDDYFQGVSEEQKKRILQGAKDTFEKWIAPKLENKLDAVHLMRRKRNEKSDGT